MLHHSLRVMLHYSVTYPKKLGNPWSFFESNFEGKFHDADIVLLLYSSKIFARILINLFAGFSKIISKYRSYRHLFIKITATTHNILQYKETYRYNNKERYMRILYGPITNRSNSDNLKPV
jgi:hypothetical protein